MAKRALAAAKDHRQPGREWLTAKQGELLSRVSAYPRPVFLAVAAVLEVYRYHPGGGYLHCQIDDGNLDSLPDEVPVNDVHGKRITPAARGRYRRCIDALWALSMDGREFACHVAHGGEPYVWIEEHERMGDEFEESDLLA